MYLFNADVFFECHPREKVTVYSYSPDYTRDFSRQRASMRDAPGVAEAAAQNPKIARLLQHWKKYEESPDVNVGYVHTRGYLSEEETLHVAVALALESLGGVLRSPISPQWRRDASVALTASSMRQRHWRNRRAWTAALLRLPFQLLAAFVRKFKTR